MMSSLSRSDACNVMGRAARSEARFSSPTREASFLSSNWREPPASSVRSRETETPTRPRETLPCTMERTGASHSAQLRGTLTAISVCLRLTPDISTGML